MTKTYDYKICKYDFYNTAIADILRAIDGGSLLGALILSFCSIDYMGLALDPTKKNTRSDFKKFVREYMGSINSKYKTLDGEIYAIRNSLVHSYGHSDATDEIDLDFQFSHQDPQKHLWLKNKGRRRELWINLPEFVGELIASVEKFFRDHKTNNTQLLQWYNRLLIIQGSGATLERLLAFKSEIIPHSQSHRFLKILEQTPEASLVEISITIEKSIKEKYGN